MKEQVDIARALPVGALHRVYDIMVGPEEAEVVLASSRGNRVGGTTPHGLVQNDLDRYCRDVLANKWVDLDHRFLFTREGRLIDGHHRATVIVRTGVPLKFGFTFGFGKNAMAAIDSNIPRSIATQTALLEHPVTASEQQRLKVYEALMNLPLDAVHKFDSMRYSASEYIVIKDEAREILDWSETFKRRGNLRLTAATWGAFMFAYKRSANPDGVTDLLQEVLSGEQSTKLGAQLRAIFMKPEEHLKVSRRVVYVHKTLHAIRKYLEGGAANNFVVQRQGKIAPLVEWFRNQKEG